MEVAKFAGCFFLFFLSFFLSFSLSLSLSLSISPFRSLIALSTLRNSGFGLHVLPFCSLLPPPPPPSRESFPRRGFLNRRCPVSRGSCFLSPPLPSPPRFSLPVPSSSSSALSVLRRLTLVHISLSCLANHSIFPLASRY